MMAGELTAGAASDQSLKPRLAALLLGVGVIGLISFSLLPWPFAVASTALGALMVAGTDVDARTYLLPDTITWGAAAAGIIASMTLEPDWWLGLATAFTRAAGTALLLALVRWGYSRIGHREGLGLGDVKLAAAIGAWLPLDAIPLCFGMAAVAALLTVTYAHFRGHRVDGYTRVPLGAFLCPALWLTFFMGVHP